MNPKVEIESTVTVAINTVEHIARRVAREVAAKHTNLPENTQAQISDETTKAVIQVYCAELVALRLRQLELAISNGAASVAHRIKSALESRS